MSKNPDVTVRFRGVIEKCSYCVQRIQQNKIEAHVDGKDIIEDGAETTDLADKLPAEARCLKAILATWRKSCRASLAGND